MGGSVRSASPPSGALRAYSAMRSSTRSRGMALSTSGSGLPARGAGGQTNFRRRN